MKGNSKTRIRFLAVLCALFLFSLFMVGAKIDRHGYNQNDLVIWLENATTELNEVKADFNLLLRRSRTFCITNAEFAFRENASAAPKIIIANAPTVIWEGRIGAGSATDNVAYTATACDDLATGEAAIYAVLMDKFGSYSILRGTTVETGESLVYPAIPIDEIPIGYFHLWTRSTGSTKMIWNPGVTLFTAEGIHTLKYNVGIMTQGATSPTTVEASDATMTPTDQ